MCTDSGPLISGSLHHQLLHNHYGSRDPLCCTNFSKYSGKEPHRSDFLLYICSEVHNIYSESDACMTVTITRSIHSRAPFTDVGILDMHGASSRLGCVPPLSHVLRSCDTRASAGFYRILNANGIVKCHPSLSYPLYPSVLRCPFLFLSSWPHSAFRARIYQIPSISSTGSFGNKAYPLWPSSLPASRIS